MLRAELDEVSKDGGAGNAFLADGAALDVWARWAEGCVAVIVAFAVVRDDVDRPSKDRVACLCIKQPLATDQEA